MIYTLMLNVMLGVWMLWFYRTQTRKTKYDGPYRGDVELVFGIFMFGAFVVASAFIWMV